MDDLIPSAHLLRHEALEVLLGTGYVHMSAAVVENPVYGKEPAFAFVHLLPVVGKRTVQ